MGSPVLNPCLLACDEARREMIMGTIVEEKWDEILEFLRTEYDVSPVSYRMWLQPLHRL